MINKCLTEKTNIKTQLLFLCNKDLIRNFIKIFKYKLYICIHFGKMTKIYFSSKFK